MIELVNSYVVRQHTGRTLRWFANHDTGDGESLSLAMLNIQGDDVRGTMAWIQEDTAREFQWLATGHGDDGEKSPAMLIQATLCEGRSSCK
jgi:hypothetical protein